jgi:hypothetical protein
MTKSFIQKPQFGLAEPDPADILLADIAVRIQLSPTKHNLADNRVRILGEQADRESGPLNGIVKRVYPQGSMAIGGTIIPSSVDEEYDIDAMVELNLPVDTDPETILATLYEAIAGTKENPTKYFEKAERHSRCIQVKYEGMHVDLTPIIPLPLLPERTGLISHSKQEEPEKREKLYANPYALAEHFRVKTPIERDFANFYKGRTAAFDASDAVLIEKAEHEQVPEHQYVHEKSRALISLQLIKRWRNTAYMNHPDLRMPPSVLLAYWVAEQAGQTQTPSLLDELLHQVQGFIKRITDAESTKPNGLVEERNPKCEKDCLTDRWPCDRSQQRLFKTELQAFEKDLLSLKHDDLTLPEMQKILNWLFGEKPVMSAMDSLLEQQGSRNRMGSGGGTPVSKSGKVLIGGPGIVTSPRTEKTRPHNFHGGKRK